MAKKLILICFISILYAGSAYAQGEKKLAETFIKSLAKKDFTLLTIYLPTVTGLKSAFGKSFTDLSPLKQTAFVKRSRLLLQKKWNTILANVKTSRINLNDLHIKDTVPYPLGADKDSSTQSLLLVTYLYKQAEWDDLLLIINSKGCHKFITDIPATTEAIDSTHEAIATFSLNEKQRGKNTEKLQLEKEKNNPEVTAELGSIIELLRNEATQNDLGSLISRIAYTGTDTLSKWKRTLMADHPEDKKTAKQWVEKIKNSLAACWGPKPEKLIAKKESGITWYSLPMNCAEKTVTYTFIKLKGEFILTDIH